MRLKKASTIIRILLWIIFLFGGAYVAITLDLKYFRGLWTSPYWHILSFIVGYHLVRLVIRSSRNTGRYLARMGKEGNIPRFETNRLVTTGYYSYMRHPMHLGLLLFPLGWAFLLGSPAFILIVAPLEMLIFVALIKLFEEKEAVRKFGQAYLQYKKDVPMFSFKPAHLKQLFSKEGLLDH